MGRILVCLLVGGFALTSKIGGEVRASPAADGGSAKVLLLADGVGDSAAAIEAPEFLAAEKKAERNEMVDKQIAARGVKDERVLAALRAVPRHEFVPAELLRQAYEDRPLPIGHGQTISQPYIVGLMSELLEIGPEDRVLEVGTGSGYQAAIVAQLARETVSIEIVGALAQRAARKLGSLGYRNLTVLHGDGYFGHEAQAPYDAIIVTAAAEHIPPPLIAQLKPNGRMVIPVGRRAWTQNLILVEKDEMGKVSTRNILAVRFVPLTRKER